VYLWGREADGTETGATVVPTGGASGGTILAFGWAQSGGDTGTLGTLAVTTATASDSFADTQIETPAITPGADNTCVVAVGMWANDYSAFGSMTAPTWADGLIGAVDSTLGADASLAVAYKIQTTASAISADAFVIGGGVTAVDLSFCVALRAAAGAPTIRFFQYNWPHQRHSRL
jgi:hypothetical protein